MSLETVLLQIDNNLNEATSRLLEFLRIRSISTDSAYKNDCERAAEWLVSDLHSLGVNNARKVKTPRHPMVMGHTDGDQPHLLFYGHYDVQPVDPVHLWHKDPFDPTIEDSEAGAVIRGRGASDDKGQLMTFIEACRAWKTVHKNFPCKITFLFEGEEESGSPSLIPFLEENKKTLKADLALICDTGLFDSRVPAITTMLRGLLGEEVTIQGPSKDLHSGSYGGVAINPIRVLSQIISKLHDDSGRITIPNFYEGVHELPAQLQTQWRNLEFNETHFLRDVDLCELAGESGRTALEMLWSRPTCEYNGIRGGYCGEGFKTVLPAKATAKISFRLVGNQDPEKIRVQFRKMVRSLLPADCTASFIEHGSGKASNFDISNPAFEAARQALTDEWDIEAVYTGCGGSIPIAGLLQGIIGTTPMLIGFGKDNDQIHSPNEKYDLQCFHKGTRSWARILAALTKI
ncbi:MAG: M20/M25/M40 family metallo-hydrolase [Aestuariivita sp.]|nr:M20/M25/M40 family metallo-hydrolase [Aestuariivita sp.]